MENGKVVCHRKIDGQYLILSRIDKNREVEKRFLSDRMRCSVYNGDKKTVMLLSTLSKLNLGMDFVYHGIMHRNTVQIAFTPKEIVQLANDKRNPIEDALNSQVEETKIMLPVVLDYETIWKNLEIKDGYLTFYYEIDEDVIDIESVYQNIEALRDYLSSSLFGLKQDEVTFMPKAKACGLGMRYLYIGDNTGKQFSVDFENNELR